MADYIIPQTLASAALAYAAGGWYVFPLRPGKKTPLLDGGVHTASKDKEKVKKWWTKYPKANIGIALAKSGLALVDIDIKPEEDGREAFNELFMLHGPVGKAAIQKTPSGGQHHIVQAPDTPIIDRVKWRPGLDIMTKEHRYIVAAPSIAADVQYTWKCKEAPWRRVGAMSAEWAVLLSAPLPDAQEDPDAKILGLDKGGAPDLLDIAALQLPDVTLDELDSILESLDASMPRDSWLKVLWGAAAQWAGSKHEAKVIERLEEWSGTTDKEGQYKPGEVAERFAEHTAARGGTSGAGHVTWRGVRAMARTAGWSPFSIGDVDPKKWKSFLTLKAVKSGDGEFTNVPKADAWNASLMLSFHKKFLHGVRRNVLTNNVELHTKAVAPLRDPTRLPVNFDRNADWPGIGKALESELNGNLSAQDIDCAVQAAANVNAYDPMKDWVESLVWDGEARLGSWLHEVTHCKDTPLNSAIGVAWMVGLAARATVEYDGRGTKMDSVLVLQGGEGIGKSTVGTIIGGKWYASFNRSLDSDDIYYVIERTMVLEFEELDSMTRSEASRVKSLVTTQQDVFRRKFGHSASEQPRRCVFIGTTNDETFLTKDMTRRRWWIVRCPQKRFNFKWLHANRDQLIAEAKWKLDRGEKPVLPSSVYNDHAKSVDDVMMAHPFEHMVSMWSSHQPRGKKILLHTAVEGALTRGYSSLTMHELRKFGECMRIAGWSRIRTSGVRGWRKE